MNSATLREILTGDVTTVNQRNLVADGFTLVAIGCFAVLAQTLLFRNFLGVVEGHELGVSCFFGAWLLWVAVGALIGRGPAPALDRVARRLPAAALLYLPAFLLQDALIRHARLLAGIQSYELFPLDHLLAAALLVNAPVSIVTGFLFTLACRRLQHPLDGGLAELAPPPVHPTGGPNLPRAARGSARPLLPVATVFILESAGGVVGGVAVTALLAAGIPGERIALYGAIPLSLAPLVATLSSRRLHVGVPLVRWPALLPFFALTLLALTGADRRWTLARDRADWSRHLPAATFRGAFSTPQARYRFGEYDGQFTVVAWESVVDTLPTAEAAAPIVAIHLAQQPAARTFLVIGPGTSALCQRFLMLPQTHALTWMDADPDYPRHLQAVLPQPLRLRDPRLTIPGTDVRHFLATSTQRFDIIILYLPAVTTLAQNRLQTVECLTALQEHLAPGGLLGMRVGGAENALGPELADAGATLYATLRARFSAVVLKPGDDTWLLASSDAPLSEKPAVLRDRFAAIPGAPALYPPDGLLSLFPPDRIAFQHAVYAQRLAQMPPTLRLNTDAHPSALLLGLLVAARESGAGQSFTATLRHLARDGAALPLIAIGLALVLRLAYRRETTRRGPAAPDWGYLVMATGAAGMAASVQLLFQFQLRHGTFLIHVGLLTALFMFGLTLGGLLISRLTVRLLPHDRHHLVLPILLAHAALLLALGFLPPTLSPAAFALLFLTIGILAGTYVPLAANAYQRRSISVARAGSTIEMLDHLGGAAGGVLAGLLLLPMFGSTWTATIFAIWILSLIPLLFTTTTFAARNGRAELREAARSETPSFRAQRGISAAIPRLAYALAGVTLFALAANHLLRRGAADLPAHKLAQAATSMLAPAAAAPRDAAPAAATPLHYFAAQSNEHDLAYVFGTHGLDDAPIGYSGPLHLAVRVTPSGVLQEARILLSDDTPTYLDRVAEWLPSLAGRRLFEANPLRDVDGLTGATLTSRAALQALQRAGPAFAAQALGAGADARTRHRAAPPDRPTHGRPRRTPCRWPLDAATPCRAHAGST